MAANQSHGRRTTLEQLMREHDALPRLARMVGCYAVSKYDAPSCAVAVRVARAKLRADAAPATILQRALDLLYDHEGADTHRFYGPDHPECPPELRGKRPPKGAWWAAQRRGAKRRGAQ